MTSELGFWITIGIGIAVSFSVTSASESKADISAISPSQAPNCSENGYMLVMGGVENPERIPDPKLAAQYGPAVWSLVESYDAIYLVRKEPDVIYEGEWPNWKLVVISKWPCMETGNEFWHSQAYQHEVKPLRKNAGVYDVGMFDAIPEPPPVKMKKPAPKACDSPFLVLALTKSTDRDNYGAYNEALRKTQLVFRAGAEFLFTGRPAKVLEGNWPEGYNALVSAYPCREAWEAVYYGDAYQSIVKPVRNGLVDMIILGFDAERTE